MRASRVSVVAAYAAIKISTKAFQQQIPQIGDARTHWITTITAEALKEILLQQQNQFEAAQLRLAETLTQQLKIQPPNSAPDTNSVDSIANSITEFHYDPDAGLIFDSWYKRYGDVFKAKLKQHPRYSNFILPKNTRDLSSDKTVQQLSMISSERLSLFNIRNQCMKLAKKESEDYITYAGRVNFECEKFKARPLNKIEQTPEITLQSITHECQSLLNPKHDTATLDRPLSNPAFNIGKTTSKQRYVVTSSNGAKPPSACWQRSERHFVRLCPYKKHSDQCTTDVGTREAGARRGKLGKDSRTWRSQSKRSQSEPRSNAILATFDNHIDARRKHVKIRANGSTIRLQLGTVFDITIASRCTWRKIGSSMNTVRNASGGNRLRFAEGTTSHGTPDTRDTLPKWRAPDQSATPTCRGRGVLVWVVAQMEFYRSLSAKKDVLSIIQCSSARKNKNVKGSGAVETAIKASNTPDLLASDFSSTPYKRVLPSPTSVQKIASRDITSWLKDVLSIIQCSSAKKTKNVQGSVAVETAIKASNTPDLLASDFSSTPYKRVLPSPTSVQKITSRDITSWSPSSLTSDLTVESSSLTTDNQTPKRSERSPLAQLQLEPANSNWVTAAKSSVTPDESSDDDAFEKFLAKLRRPPSPKYSSGSSSSFFTDNSSSGSQVSDEQLFYCQFDNAARSADVEAEKFYFNLSTTPTFPYPLYSRLPLHKQISPSFGDKPTDGVHQNSSAATELFRRPPATIGNLSRRLERPRESRSQLRSPTSKTCVSRSLSSTSLPVWADFVSSLYPLEEGDTRRTGRRRHPSAERFVKRFKANRVELANRLFRIFNEKVFDKRLPDDLSIVWNTRLLRTAGQCKYLRREVIPRVGEKTITRIAQIELSPKVCTSAERVRDTLLHEVCHAAVWILDGVNDGHGSRWRRWANRAMQVWPDIPVVSVCHAYTIETKFTYRCTGCGACINRHSKSIDTEKQICGRCRSRFELLINTPRGRMMRPSVAGTMDKRLLAHCTVRPQVQQTQSSELSEKRRPAFADFVRENYRHVRQKPEIKTHADAMTELGSLFKTMRISKVQQNSDIASLPT
ncbi:hypothetical protein T265_00617 [Opisthorchis viverrini]|uniref:SprT-like domain-containing protein n=1 Tax=Opisthorchis viverrini TaxID=6198 RepID=A0A075A2A6_OPIVI|nr:hypothetical protein T265_00617 [Opisthorchis viverrini]KER33501.1 hypothetical protein T265_00617 [Opisthorchis viverrini]